MLTVEERFMIKDLQRKGASISEIARQTQRDRKTVRRALRDPLTVSQTRKPRKRKIDPYLEYIHKRMEQGVYNVNAGLKFPKSAGLKVPSSIVRFSPSSPTAKPYSCHASGGMAMILLGRTIVQPNIHFPPLAIWGIFCVLFKIAMHKSQSQRKILEASQLRTLALR